MCMAESFSLVPFPFLIREKDCVDSIIALTGSAPHLCKLLRSNSTPSLMGNSKATWIRLLCSYAIRKV